MDFGSPLCEKMVTSSRTSSPTFSVSLIKMDPADLEQKQKKLLTLFHASRCNYEGCGDCPEVLYCCASKRVFEHIITCTTEDCYVPGCKKCRKIWKHYRKCMDVNCSLCLVAPSPYSSKFLSDRFRKTVSSSKDTNDDVSLGVQVDEDEQLMQKAAVRRLKASALLDKENTAVASNTTMTQSLKVGKNSIIATPDRKSKRPPLSPQRPIWALYP